MRIAMAIIIAALMQERSIAEAQDKAFFAEAVLSTAAHDRGEQIGIQTLELAVGVELPVEFGLAYGVVYQRLPIGEHEQIFDGEVDYTFGVNWEGGGYRADVSANWLTYPGEAAESSLELIAAIDFDAPFTPGILVFYDVHAEAMGLEATAGPRWTTGVWDLYALGRTGFVVLGDSLENRTYVGLEIGVGRAVSESVEFGLFLRADAADAQSFAGPIDSGTITDFRNSGISVGVALSVAL